MGEHLGSQVIVVVTIDMHLITNYYCLCLGDLINHPLCQVMCFWLT